MNRKEALDLIQESRRHDHSLLVSKIMSILAQHLDVNQIDWELAGILHDLDYDETIENREKHGILASETLKDKVGDDIIQAIRSHHRTGIKPTTLLDHSLIYADAVSIVIAETSSVYEEKPWIREIIDSYELPASLRFDNLVRLSSC